LAESQPEGEAAGYMLRIAEEAWDTTEAKELAELLDLEPGRGYYRLAYPLAHPSKSPSQATLYVETRSVLGIMNFLSLMVEVPKQDQDNDRVNINRSKTPESPYRKGILGFPFSIKTRSARPDHAAVAVRYRDRWFYIEDADLRSKGTFSLLTQIFSLQASAIPITPPVLTLPVGR
jgi:hypothetical protein